MKTEHTQFSGSVPSNYEKYMGPLFFEPYALDIVSRIDTAKAKRVLEIACGTGRVTNHLRKTLSHDATLIATDLNTGMIEVARQRLQNKSIEFVEADAQQLPFDDNSFDVIVCQFGYMFVPDKQKAFDETYRVLKQGGKLLFSTWDKLENNQLSLIVRDVVAENLSSAADFYKVPFSMHDKQQIEFLLQQAGFKKIQIELVIKRGTNVTASEAAKGLILGTPAIKAISEKGSNTPIRLAEIAGKELEKLFGNGIIQTQLNAWVCEARK